MIVFVNWLEYAVVAELVYAYASGAYVAKHGSSSLPHGTKIRSIFVRVEKANCLAFAGDLKAAVIFFQQKK